LLHPLRPDDGRPQLPPGTGSGGKGFFVEDPKHIRGALDEAMNHRGPALVNIALSQGSARKPQQFRWHS
jgi:thiamine pyrophosphate-dependent acetolactate synthase large subunit-like protein